MKKLSFIIFIFFGFSQMAVAQIEPMYGMYRFNALALNPAQAGTTVSPEISGLSRWQWSGIEGAPNTSSITFNTPYKQNVGFGATIISDRLGPVSDFYVGLDYGYHIRLNNKLKLSSGLRLGIINHRVDLTNRQIVDQNDPAFKTNMNTGYRINPGLGFLLTGENFFAGVSMPRLLRYSFGTLYNVSAYKDVSHTFLYGGWNKVINQDITFRPSVNVNFSPDAPISLDVNAMVTLNRILDLGLMLRGGDAVGLVLGYRASPNLYLGYSYEYPTSVINRVSFMSNEVALRFTLGAVESKKVLTPRYFN